MKPIKTEMRQGQAKGYLKLKNGSLKNEKLTEQILVALNNRQKQAIIEIANREEVSMSVVIRAIIDEYLKG